MHTTSFYTEVTESGLPVFAALHEGEADPKDRCVTIAVGMTATVIAPNDARRLGETLLRAADAVITT